MTRTAGCSSRKPSKDSSVRWKTEEPDSDQGTSGVFGCGAWGLKQEMGKGATGVRNILKYRHITTAVPSCGEQKSNAAVVHTPPTVTHAQKWSKAASPLSTEHNVASGFTKRMDKHSAHSIKKDSRALSDKICGFPATTVAVLWWLDFMVVFF